jgi:4-hydroxy-tetrahydrodipicolinate reductase
MENRIRIGVLGFGKTGRAVATTVLRHSSFELCWAAKRSREFHGRGVAELTGITSNNKAPLLSLDEMPITTILEAFPVDVILDFSAPGAIYHYGESAAARNVTIVSAISHYEDEDVAYLRELASGTRVFWSANITLGVNYLMFAGRFLKKIAPWVDVEVVEEHFRGKQGVSGTAKKLAEALDVDSTRINSVRAGGIVGRHEVIFGFPYQTVRLIHESISREAFGTGALFAAQHLMDKENGFYTFEDLLQPFFSAEGVQV